MKIRTHSTYSGLVDAPAPATSRSSCTPGRTAPGPKVTNATPGQSKHNTTRKGSAAAEAFDIVPLVGSGKAERDSKPPTGLRQGLLARRWACGGRTGGPPGTSSSTLR